MKQKPVISLMVPTVIGLLFAMHTMAVAANKVVVVPLTSSGVGSGDTTIAFSPLNMTPIQGLAVNYTYSFEPGYLQLNSNGYEDEWPQLPLDIPYQIGGTALKLKQLKICYEMSSASAEIKMIRFNSMSDDGTVNHLLTDNSDRTSLTWQCDNLTVEPPSLLSGSSSITFWISFGAGSSTMKIGTVELTLGP